MKVYELEPTGLSPYEIACQAVDNWAEGCEKMNFKEQIDVLKFSLAAIIRDHPVKKTDRCIIEIERHPSGSVVLNMGGKGPDLVDMMIKAMQTNTVLPKIIRNACMVLAMNSMVEGMQDFDQP